MNWFAFAMQVVSMIPSVVVGVQAIAHAGASGADKKQLALQSLGLAYGVGSNILPQFQPHIDAVTALASSAIDTAVALAKLQGHPAFTTVATVAPGVTVEAPATVQPIAQTPVTDHVTAGGFSV